MEDIFLWRLGQFFVWNRCHLLLVILLFLMCVMVSAYGCAVFKVFGSFESMTHFCPVVNLYICPNPRKMKVSISSTRTPSVPSARQLANHPGSHCLGPSLMSHCKAAKVCWLQRPWLRMRAQGIKVWSCHVPAVSPDELLCCCLFLAENTMCSQAFFHIIVKQVERNKWYHNCNAPVT